MSGRIGYLLSRLGAAARDRFAAALAPLGIRPNHYGALRLLQTHEPASQQTLAAGLSVDRSVIVGIVDHLESLGAVQRQPDPQDRRRYALHLTTTGQDLIKRADAIAEQLQEQRLAPLTTRQRRDLLTLLDILARHELGSATTSARTPRTPPARAPVKPDLPACPAVRDATLMQVRRQTSAISRRHDPSGQARNKLLTIQQAATKVTTV